MFLFIMNLGIIQKKILYLLSANCRYTNKDIAKIVKTSEDTINYQINNLIEEKQLAEYRVHFDWGILGYKYYQIVIKCKLINNDVTEYLKARDDVLYINTSFGKYNLQIGGYVKDMIIAEGIFNEISKKINVEDFEIMHIYDYYKGISSIIPEIKITDVKLPQNQKSVLYSLNMFSKIYPSLKSNSTKKYELDDVDFKIVQELDKNPKITYKQLALNTNLNPETIRYRIKNMIEQKFLISFSLFHHHEKYGYYVNYMLLKIKDTNNTKLINYLESNDYVFFAPKLQGGYNTLIYVLSKNPEELNSIYSQITQILQDEIIKFDLISLDKIHKEEFNLRKL